MPSSLPFSNASSGVPLTKVGKILVKKSGQVIMRIPQSDGTHVDLELNEGITTNSYQELAALQKGQDKGSIDQVNYVAPVTTRLVAMPDLESMLNL